MSVFPIAIMALNGVHLAMIFAHVVADAVRYMAFEILEYADTAIRMCKGLGNCALTKIVTRFFNLAAVGVGLWLNNVAGRHTCMAHGNGFRA